jgi:flagellar biosynthesis component FlhA
LAAARASFDAATAVATHLNKVLRENASVLLGHDEVQQLLDKLVLFVVEIPTATR